MKLDINLESIQAKTGEEILKINEYYVHSKYNPMREAQQIVEKNYSPHHVHIIFGYGSGYLIDQLLKRRAFNEKIIVIDPLFEEDIIKVRHQESNLFCLDHSVIPVLERYMNSIAKEVRVSFITFCTSNYDKIFPILYKSLLLKVKEIQYKNRTNDYTIIRYSKEWQRNFIQNLNHVASDININKLEKNI